jgi:hypothetical protein
MTMIDYMQASVLVFGLVAVGYLLGHFKGFGDGTKWAREKNPSLGDLDLDFCFGAAKRLCGRENVKSVQFVEKVQAVAMKNKLANLDSLTGAYVEGIKAEAIESFPVILGVLIGISLAQNSQDLELKKGVGGIDLRPPTPGPVTPTTPEVN